MKLEDDILNELQSLSPLLAGLQKTTVFFVPEGYFETLSSTVLICVKEEVGTLNNIKAEDIPEGYFENLSSSILNKIKAQEKYAETEELAQLSKSVQGIQPKKLFEVPDSYFENLSTSILDKIKTGANNTVEDEKEELSPLLQSLRHVNVYEVPEGYFNTVQQNVFGAVKATTATTAKVVSIFKRRFILKFAAAAVITGAMALGVYKYTNKPVVNTMAPEVSFVKLDSSIEKGKNMNELQFNEALNNLTKEDITSYLEKNGSDEDMSLLTNNVEVNDLPGKDDYLLDEKTLENYLDKIKFQN